jgi:hypothetical protein
MLVGRRSRHVVLLIKVSVISRDPPRGRSYYAVSTMSMIESSAQASHWPSRISARSVARRYASHLANCPQAGPLWCRRFWYRGIWSVLDDTLHDEGAAEALDAWEGGEAVS